MKEKFFLILVLLFFGISLYSQEGIPITKEKDPDGYSNMLFNQGLTYYKLNNLKESFKSFSRSAKSGNADAQLNLGYLHLNGEGTPKNFKKAFELFKKSASRNNAIAQYNVGIMLIGGIGTHINMQEAAIWIRKSFLNGHTYAKEIWDTNELWNYTSLPIATK